MAPPPPSAAARFVPVVLRFFTVALLLASLVILLTNSETMEFEVIGLNLDVKFNDIYAYRYMLATIVIGLAYTLLQLVFSICHTVTGNRIFAGDASFTFDFFGDKVISYVLATGAAAAFGATKDMKTLLSGLGDMGNFFNKAYASASLLLMGFVLTAILSLFSSYALPKRV